MGTPLFMPAGTAAALEPFTSPGFRERYRVLEELGRGALGVDYRASQRSPEREVCLRFPPIARADLTQVMVENAHALSDLIHPNIVRYFDAGVDVGRPYLVCELTRGVPLSRILERSGRLEVAAAVILACQICDGLAVAHDRGVVHGDIQPDHMIVLNGTIAKLADFGLTRLVQLESAGAVGTPAYMAPEYVQGQPPDARCDLYSVGVTLYRMLAGRVPFEGDDPHDVLTRQIVEPPPRLAGLRPDVPPLVEELVMKLLSKRPADRPRSAAFLAIELRRATAPVHPISLLPLELMPLRAADDASPGWMMMAAVFGLAGAALTVGLLIAMTWAAGAGP